jgi:hypothetical protein
VPETEVLVVEALESVVWPVTERVPPTVSLLATVDVPTDAVVAVRFVATALVVVELPTTRLVMLVSVATSDEKKPLVEVALVTTAFVVVELPIVTPVRFAIVAKRLETKEFEEVLLVVLNAVIAPDAAVRDVTVVVARVEVPVVVSVPPTTVLPDTVSAVADAVERVVWPEIEREEADAVPRDDVPEVSVEKIPVVKVGLAERAMVFVPEKVIFDPATRLATGLLKKLFQAVEDAVSGREYPACVPSVKV